MCVCGIVAIKIMLMLLGLYFSWNTRKAGGSAMRSASMNDDRRRRMKAKDKKAHDNRLREGEIKRNSSF